MSSLLGAAVGEAVKLLVSALGTLGVLGLWAYRQVRRYAHHADQIENENLYDRLEDHGTRIEAIEETMSTHEQRLAAIEERADDVKDLDRYLRGDDDDPGDKGLLKAVHDLREQMENLSDELDDVERRRENDREDLNERLDRIEQKVDDSGGQ